DWSRRREGGRDVASSCERTKGSRVRAGMEGAVDDSGVLRTAMAPPMVTTTAGISSAGGVVGLALPSARQAMDNITSESMVGHTLIVTVSAVPTKIIGAYIQTLKLLALITDRLLPSEV